MVRLTFKQGLSLFLAAAMVNPIPTWAGSSAAVVGSINSYGAVTVGQSAAPASSTLFAGDTVKTQTGSAVVQYEQGARVVLAKTSTAVFSPKAVELKSGQMSFSTATNKDMTFNATSLRLEPMSPKTAADVVVNDGKASISVREGSVRAVDPTGVSLAVIPAGEAKLFAMAASPAAPAPAAPAASAAAAPLGAVAAMWLVIGVGVIGGTIAGIAIAQTSDDEEEVEDRAVSPVRP